MANSLHGATHVRHVLCVRQHRTLTKIPTGIKVTFNQRRVRKGVHHQSLSARSAQGTRFRKPEMLLEPKRPCDAGYRQKKNNNPFARAARRFRGNVYANLTAAPKYPQKQPRSTCAHIDATICRTRFSRRSYK